MAAERDEPAHEEAPPQQESAAPLGRRRALPLALIALASLLAFLSIFALWADRQLLDTDTWASTSSELLENEAIRDEVSVLLVDELYANVDVKAEIAAALPPNLKPLAGPAAGGLRNLAVQGTEALLERPRVQTLWEEANRRAHARFIQVVEGGGDTVSTEGGTVTLDLKSLLQQTADRVGVGGRAAAQIPAGSAQVTILRSDSLAAVQDGVRLLRDAAPVLVVLWLLTLAAAIALARGWRREALRAAGWGFVLAGLAALVTRKVAGDAIVDSLVSTEGARPAAEAAWSITTSLLVEAAWASVLYGVVAVAGAWLAGPTSWAVGIRRALAPYLREPLVAYAGLAIVVLLLLAWGPTPALRQPVTALVLVALLVLGFELLRRQAVREFPAASRAEALARLRWRVSALRRRGDHAGEAPDTAGQDRLEQLERLGRLRDAGVLDEPEFEREKAALVATTSAAGDGAAEQM